MQSFGPAESVTLQRRVIPPPIVAPPVERIASLKPLGSPSAKTSGLPRLLKTIIQLQMGVCCLLVGLIALQFSPPMLVNSRQPIVATSPPENESVGKIPTPSDFATNRAGAEKDLMTAASEKTPASSPASYNSVRSITRSPSFARLEPYTVGDQEANRVQASASTVNGAAGVKKTAFTMTREAVDYLGAQWVLAKENLGRAPESQALNNSSKASPIERLPDSVSGICQDGSCNEINDRLGTTIHWADQPEDAYRTAEVQNKLVFLIHVSGNFKIPGFT